jgi:hypothetical protein
MEFRPYDVGNMKRYGRNEDGGYVIHNDPLGASSKMIYFHMKL